MYYKGHKQLIASIIDLFWPYSTSRAPTMINEMCYKGKQSHDQGNIWPSKNVSFYKLLLIPLMGFNEE